MSSLQVQQEGRLQLAIKALRNDEFDSVREAARMYDVPRATLTRRLHGVPLKRGMPAATRKLTQQEEDVLVKWILDIDSRGYAPRVGDVRRKANTLLAERVRGSDIVAPTVGVNWATQLVKRRTDLRSNYFRKKDYQRALYEDPEIVQKWFDLVRNTIAKYGVVDDDV